MKYLVLLPALVVPLPSAANVLYKCTGASGVVLYTNQKSADRKCEVLSRTAVPPAPASSAAPARAKTAQPSPADFPKVSGSEQKVRDSDRRAILDREMAAEAANLEKARRDLAAGASQPAEAQRALRDTVALHERNVEALKKELGNLR